MRIKFNKFELQELIRKANKNNGVLDFEITAEVEASSLAEAELEKNALERGYEIGKKEGYYEGYRHCHCCCRH